MNRRELTWKWPRHYSEEFGSDPEPVETSERNFNRAFDRVAMEIKLKRENRRAAGIQTRRDTKKRGGKSSFGKF